MTMRCVLMTCLVLFVPVAVFAETIPLGESIEIEMPLGEIVVIEDAVLCGTTFKQKDRVQEFTSKQQLVEKVKDRQSLLLTMSRNNEHYTANCTSNEVEALLRISLDQVAGVGTLTFYDSESNTYYALGHPIQEQVSGLIPTGDKGLIRLAAVDQIVPSKPKHPGFKVTKPLLPLQIAPIASNSVYGLKGDASEFENWFPNKQSIERAEPKLGDASIRTVVAGEAIVDFQIEIVAVEEQKFYILVTDPRVLRAAGGIVQGMSGSPIIQKGKLVGALTHMNSEQPDKGAAIPISVMIN